MQSTPLLFTNNEDTFSCVESHIMSRIMKNIIFTFLCTHSYRVWFGIFSFKIYIEDIYFFEVNTKNIS